MSASPEVLLIFFMVPNLKEMLCNHSFWHYFLKMIIVTQCLEMVSSSSAKYWRRIERRWKTSWRKKRQNWRKIKLAKVIKPNIVTKKKNLSFKFNQYNIHLKLQSFHHVKISIMLTLTKLRGKIAVCAFRQYIPTCCEDVWVLW